MRPQAGLILTATMFATGMVALATGAGHTLEWQELAAAGGAAGAVLTLWPYLRWLEGRGPDGSRGPAVPRFWQGMASLVLFGFWACVVLALNTAGSFAPIERTHGVVAGKRVAAGRYSDSHYAEVLTPRGPVEASVPRDVWQGVAVGQGVSVRVCGGLLGYTYVVTALDRGPFLDLRRLMGLPQRDPVEDC